MSTDELIVRRADGVVHLTLNRPERRNALTPELIGALHAVLDEIDADESTRAVVVAGEGSAFCAGFDITRIESPGSPGSGAERDLVEELLLQGLRIDRSDARAHQGDDRHESRES